MNKLPFTPLDQDKINGLNHALYEMKMFLSLPQSTNNALVSNCFTEAFLIHARVLCGFFQSPRHQDDIICSDFGFEQRELGIHEDIDKRFHKCLAHLTYSRNSFADDTKHWLLKNFQPQLRDRIREFLLHITTNSSLQWKVEDIVHATSLLKKLRHT